MNDSRVNYHRSFGALVVGNLIAIFLSGLTCILIGQATYPDYFQQLRVYKQEQKKQSEEAKAGDVKKAGSKKNDRDPKEAASKKDEQQKVLEQKDKPEENKEQKDKKEVDEAKATDKLVRPEIPFGFLVVTLVTDVVFAGLAGLACVLVAGFARNHHGMFMALFIVVWKVQQLLGDVQIPATILMIELVALPIACMVGASSVAEDDSGDEEVETAVEE